MLKGKQDVAGDIGSRSSRSRCFLGTRGLVAADPTLTLLPWATSPGQCAVSNNSQTTDLIFCKKQAIIGHFYMNGMRSHTHRHTHTYSGNFLCFLDRNPAPREGGAEASVPGTKLSVYLGGGPSSQSPRARLPQRPLTWSESEPSAFRPGQ